MSAGAAAVSRFRVLALDLLFMAVNFSALTLFSSLKDVISAEYGFSSAEMQWAAIAYSMGIFFAFLIGHSKFFEERPRVTVLFAGFCATIPQLLIPFIPNAIAVAALRFVQGLVMSSVPIFSYQGGKFFPGFRTLAIGTIVSGIFIGGLVGSTAGPYLAAVTGWRTTYVIFGVLMTIIAVLWVLLTPNEALPPTGREIKEVKPGIWRRKFTWVWGFTFFSGLWIVFTLAPLIHFIAEEQLGIKGYVASTALESSYIAWSYIVGMIARYLCRKATTRWGTFRGIALTQIIHYALTAAGAIIALVAKDPVVFLASLFVVAAVQGTGPTFWSIPTVAYPEEIASRAGYALGLLANSATLIGPAVTLIISALAITGTWLIVVCLSVFGALITLTSLKLKLPIEEGGGSET